MSAETKIIRAVTEAVSGLAPLTGPAAPFVTLAATGIEAILSLAEGLGERDAVLAALDATLAAARHRTDVDLARKHAPLTAIPLETRTPVIDLSPPRLNLRHVIRGGPFTADDLPVLPSNTDDEDGA